MLIQFLFPCFYHKLMLFSRFFKITNKNDITLINCYYSSLLNFLIIFIAAYSIDSKTVKNSVICKCKICDEWKLHQSYKNIICISDTCETLQLTCPNVCWNGLYEMPYYSMLQNGLLTRPLSTRLVKLDTYILKGCFNRAKTP